MKQRLRFLWDGSGEIGRKFQRSQLRGQLGKLGRQRGEALFILGNNAWKDNIDLSAFPELREQLLKLDQRQSDLAATSSKLQTERAALESKRTAEIERFDSLARPVLAKKTETDSALKSARTRLSESNRTISALESRLSRLASDLARLEAAPAPGQPPRERLEAEQTGLSGELTVLKPARESQTAEVAALEAESRRCREEQARIDAERKAALAPIDAELRRIELETRGTSRESSDVGSERKERLTALGTALYQGKTEEPALVESMEAVEAIDTSRAQTQAAIDASLAVTASMPPRTMLKFWATPALIFAILVFGTWATLSWFGGTQPVNYATDSEEQESTLLDWFRRSSPSGETGAPSGVHTEEARKDAIVEAFLKSPRDASKRQSAIEVLEMDLNTLGSGADRAHLPHLLRILAGGEPELRAAAAHAIGMLGPGESEGPALRAVLNDPIPGVRLAALSALGQLRDPSAQLLVRQVQYGERSRTRQGEQRFQADTAPDARSLGVPIYPGASFLYYTSDLEIGRAAFTSEDPIEQVLDFYSSKAGRPPVNAKEFTQIYLAGSSGDPTGSNRLITEMQEIFKQASAANKPEAEIIAEIERRQAQMLNLPGVRYIDSQLYGAPRFVAVEEKNSGDGRRAVRYVAVFRDEALGRTGFEVFVTP
jgi:hypothetical protein